MTFAAIPWSDTVLMIKTSQRHTSARLIDIPNSLVGHVFGFQWVKQALK
jgi:hypothetical protein